MQPRPNVIEGQLREQLPPRDPRYAHRDHNIFPICVDPRSLSQVLGRWGSSHQVNLLQADGGINVLLAASAHSSPSVRLLLLYILANMKV